MLLTIIFIILLCFSLVLFFGAPYLPTLSKQQIIALKLLDLKPGQTLLEPGCGDGRMLKLAAKHGIKGIGYELNPIIYFVAKINTWQYRKLIIIKYGNFWTAKWPRADGMYVFLLDRFMERLNNKVIQQYKDYDVKLVSYTFKIPGKQPLATKDGMFLYQF